MKRFLRDLATLLVLGVVTAFGIELLCPIQSAHAQTLQTSMTAGLYYSFPAVSTTGATASISVSSAIPTKHGMQVNTTGAPAACTYNLEGSLDNTNWTPIISGQACTTSGLLAWDTTGLRPVLFVRANVTALSGGATATPIYVGSK